LVVVAFEGGLADVHTRREIGAGAVDINTKVSHTNAVRPGEPSVADSSTVGSVRSGAIGNLRAVYNTAAHHPHKILVELANHFVEVAVVAV